MGHAIRGVGGEGMGSSEGNGEGERSCGSRVPPGPLGHCAERVADGRSHEHATRCCIAFSTMSWM
jgi:hypothetical protein